MFLVKRFRKFVMPWHARLMMLANGEYRPPKTTGLLEAMGLEEGLMDLCLLLPRGRTRWLEIKLIRTERHGATGLSDTQRELHDEFRWLDHTVDVVRTFDQLWDIVEEEGIPHRRGARLPPIIQESLDLKPRRRRRVSHAE